VPRNERLEEAVPWIQLWIPKYEYPNIVDTRNPRSRLDFAVMIHKAILVALAMGATLNVGATVVTAQQHHHHGAEGGDANAVLEKLGAVHMPISCAASVQAPFERGIALLHSFWYEEALKQFQSVAAADPQCAMAQWVIAMTEWRPFWDGMPAERRKTGIAEIDKAVALHPRTDREQRYIAALRSYLHADLSQNEKAVHAYADAMGALHTAYPDDVEAQAFYGLALAARYWAQASLYNAGRAPEAAENTAEALAFYQQLLKVTNDGAHTQRPAIIYARSFIHHSEVHVPGAQ
jgi:tetratricopeptide (TPR) repeat protein